MSRLDHLFQAILDDPDDNDRRLVYADRLEDEGDPARAEFIQVQIALARQPHGPSARRLERRQQFLLHQHGAIWLSGLPEPFGSRCSSADVDQLADFFRRGFVTELELSGQEFVEHIDELVASTPLEGIRLSDPFPEDRDLLSHRTEW